MIKMPITDLLPVGQDSNLHDSHLNQKKKNNCQSHVDAVYSYVFTRKTRLTVVALDCVNVYRGVELPGAEEPPAVERVPRAVGWCSEGAGVHSPSHAIIFILLLFPRSLHIHLLLFCSFHIMDAHQEAVVHDL